jgi:hypothetical protein
VCRARDCHLGVEERTRKVRVWTAVASSPTVASPPTVASTGAIAKPVSPCDEVRMHGWQVRYRQCGWQVPHNGRMRESMLCALAGAFAGAFAGPPSKEVHVHPRDLAVRGGPGRQGAFRSHVRRQLQGPNVLVRGQQVRARSYRQAALRSGLPGGLQAVRRKVRSLGCVVLFPDSIVRFSTNSLVCSVLFRFAGFVPFSPDSLVCSLPIVPCTISRNPELFLLCARLGLQLTFSCFVRCARLFFAFSRLSSAQVSVRERQVRCRRWRCGSSALRLGVRTIWIVGLNY